MPDYTLIASRARDSAFELRVRAALVYKARQVYTAGATGQEAAFSYATGVLRDPLQYSGTASWGLATDPDIINVPLATSISDATIETAMNRTWPSLVGLRG